MKFLNHTSMLRLALGLLMFFTTNARAYSQAGQYVTIGSNTVEVDNLTILDSVESNNRLARSLAFELNLSTDETTLALISQFEQSLSSNKILTISVVLTGATLPKGKTSSAGPFAEERIYAAAVVKELILSPMNAIEKKGLTLQVKIDGGSNVSVKKPDRQNGNERKQDRINRLGASNFSVRFGNLESRFVTSISPLSIGSVSPLGSKFSIEVYAAEKQSWADQFGDGAGKILKDGTIEILSQDLKNVELTIYLKDIIIISYQSNNKDAAVIPKVTFGLKAGSISLTRPK
jgi:hypothetical protein